MNRNLKATRAFMNDFIHNQAILEGIPTNYRKTKRIIENGRVLGMAETDIKKILNLKCAWEFILDEDVIQSETDYYLLCHIAKLVNAEMFSGGGRLRSIPVTIGGCSYVPPIPIEADIKESIMNIVHSDSEPLDTAIRLCLYCMKSQIFMDGNKRASVIFANHFLIANGEGILVVPDDEVPKFRRLLVAYYDGQNENYLADFMRSRCWKKY